MNKLIIPQIKDNLYFVIFLHLLDFSVLLFMCALRN